ncbi:hypothetical protein MMC12_006151 [Toensbergia leucococca]|nr:hypothetical protein [Toensbergia leucococca]
MASACSVWRASRSSESLHDDGKYTKSGSECKYTAGSEVAGNDAEGDEPTMSGDRVRDVTSYYDFAYERKGPFRMATTNIGDATAKTFAELLSGPMMDIYVGKSKRHWSLHRNLLCHHSTYFQDNFGEEHKNKTGKLELLDQDPRAFELLVKWLYQGKIDDVSDMPMDKKWDYADACQKLYLLCDKINLPQLKNFAIDQFRKGCFEAGLVPGPEEMKPIYDNTPPSSPFRRLVSRIAARQIMDPDSQNDAGTYRMWKALEERFSQTQLEEEAVPTTNTQMPKSATLDEIIIIMYEEILDFADGENDRNHRNRIKHDLLAKIELVREE